MSPKTAKRAGKYEEALAALRDIPEEANPALVGYQLAWARFNLGRKDEAAATLTQLLKEHPEDTGGLYTSVQAVMAAAGGQNRAAEAKIRAAIVKGKGFGHFHHTAYHIGCAYARMNKAEPAIKWLQTAADDGFPCYPLFMTDANLDPLRKDPRFVSLLAELKRQWDHNQTIL